MLDVEGVTFVHYVYTVALNAMDFLNHDSEEKLIVKDYRWYIEIYR